MEKLTTSRLRDHLTSNLALADNQYGFRRERSILDALGRLKSICKTATAGHAFHHKLVGMLTLDVRNAFNSAPWSVIIPLSTAKDVPVAILNLINDYLSERKIEVASPSGNVNFVKNMSCGVPQGSVLGPDLWNLMYDDLLRTEMPNGVELIAFADDVAVVSTASAAYLLEESLELAFNKINSWMVAHGLNLAANKTVAILSSPKTACGTWGYRSIKT